MRKAVLLGVLVLGLVAAPTAPAAAQTLGTKTLLGWMWNPSLGEINFGYQYSDGLKGTDTLGLPPGFGAGHANDSTWTSLDSVAPIEAFFRTGPSDLVAAQGLFGSRDGYETILSAQVAAALKAQDWNPDAIGGEDIPPGDTHPVIHALLPAPAPAPSAPAVSSGGGTSATPTAPTTVTEPAPTQPSGMTFQSQVATEQQQLHKQIKSGDVVMPPVGPELRNVPLPVPGAPLTKWNTLPKPRAVTTPAFPVADVAGGFAALLLLVGGVLGLRRNRAAHRAA